MIIDFDDDTKKIKVALENPRWKYRTLDGIAKETGIPKTIIKSKLEHENKIIYRSVIKRRDGKILYASKYRIPKLNDYWNAVKAINAVKYGVDYDND